MDQQQLIQMLDQIPLDFLVNYVNGRTQQEQDMASADAAAAQDAYAQEAAAQEAMAAQQGASQGMPMQAAYGGRIRNWNPYFDPYACGGRLRGSMGSTRR